MIEYQWRVLESHTEDRCMAVEYSSENRQTFVISTRLPTVDETLDDVIASFAPINAWLEAEKTVIAVEVGTFGSQTTDSATEDAPALVPSISMTPVQL